MYFEQFFVEGLGHASYLVASDTTKEALVVDPRRDIQVYVEAIHRLGFELRYVLETHNHNDFLSGARHLAECLGAEHVASAEAGLQFPYRGVREGDELQLGELRIRVLRTPGHTPEHVSYAVIDTARAEAPFLVFSGGDLLVGTVGRPDLLGRELGEQLAPQLYDSLHQKLLPLGDHVIVFPTHGSGSLCGRGIAGTRFTTIGYERLANPALQQPSREAFVRFVLQGNPGIPTYYARMRPSNQRGPAPFRAPEPRPLPPLAVQHLAGHGAIVVDTRANVAFGGAHVPGAINIGLGPMFATWVGWLLPPDAPLLFVLDRDTDWEAATTALLRIGYEQFAGYLQFGMASWVEHGLPVERVEQLSVHELRQRLLADPAVQVLDVRMASEWAEGRIERAVHLPLGDLPRGLDALPLDRTRPVAVVCGSGYRSSIATSLLKGRGFTTVWNVLGGMTAWKEAGYPLVDGTAPITREAEDLRVRDAGQHLVRRVAVGG
ncbi:MAG TPA: rhodanese-like domain-containing protein [Chloroflexota bacterium]|nr:rhodanese-like domain-containing protein [Chloroflexota bacterium]